MTTFLFAMFSTLYSYNCRVHTDIISEKSKKANKTGRLVAQLAEQAPRIQRLCPHRSCHRFDSTCGPLLHVIPPSLPCFLFSCPIQEIKVQKAPQKSLKPPPKKPIGQQKKSRVFFRGLTWLVRHSVPLQYEALLTVKGKYFETIKRSSMPFIVDLTGPGCEINKSLNCKVLLFKT